MTGDSTAGDGLGDLVENAVALHFLHDGGYKAVLHLGMGDEDPARHQLALPIVQPVLDVIAETPGHRAPVFLHHLHLAVDDLNAGLQVQQIGAQGHDRGATAALDHVVQPAQQEAGLHPGGKGLELPPHGLGVRAGLCQAAGLQDHQTVARGQVPGIHHIDIGETLSRQASVLVAGGHIGADGDMEHGVIAGSETGEQVRVFANAHRRRGAQGSAAVHMGEDILRRNVDAVVIGAGAHADGKGCDGNIIFLDKGWGQVAGAVGTDLDFHDKTSMCGAAA